ncbi:MAG: type IV pilus modification PilV family protein [Microgenomates group bacterium]
MKDKKGQALFEVVIAIGVILILVVALIITATYSLRNAEFSRSQMLATKYAQEAIEKIRLFRDNNPWNTFILQCNSFDLGMNLPSNFSLTRQCFCLSDICEVKIVINWQDSKGNHKSELTTKITKK